MAQRAASITVKQVARRARVSVATVSRVLNGKGSALESTRQRVRVVTNIREGRGTRTKEVTIAPSGIIIRRSRSESEPGDRPESDPS